MTRAANNFRATGWGAAILGCLVGGCSLALPVGAQDASQALLSSGHGSGADAVVLREIVDPATGDHWWLVRDPARPGAPGRLLLVSGPAKAGSAQSVADLNQSALPPVTSFKPIIRGGDKVVVEETTPVLEARFEGIALEPAAEGAELNVRLKVSGGVVRAVAMGPGRVVIISVEGNRR
jgi:hypothetical protein